MLCLRAHALLVQYIFIKPKAISYETSCRYSANYARAVAKTYQEQFLQSNKNYLALSSTARRRNFAKAQCHGEGISVLHLLPRKKERPAIGFTISENSFQFS